MPAGPRLVLSGKRGNRGDSKRGGNYVLRGLFDIQEEMRMAAATLEDALFLEYWGVSVAPDLRIAEWLTRADKFASGWKPSDDLFLKTKV